MERHIDTAYANLRLVKEAQAQLEIEGKWDVRTSFWKYGVRCIEEEKQPDLTIHAPMPEDAEVEFGFEDTNKRTQLIKGDDAWAQAREAQEAFGQTLLCSPIEKSGDLYVIRVFKPSVYPVTFVRGEGKNEERIQSWVDSTKLKVAQEEARRLLGGKITLEKLAEPGAVYRVKAAGTRSQKPRAKPPKGSDITTRIQTGTGIKPMASPCTAHRRAA
jgi:hypothetical protein